MKVELEAVDGFAEVYTVRATEDDGPRAIVIGKVRRMSPSDWEFSLATGVGLSPTPVSFTIHAATVDELRGAIRDRFGLLEISRDRVSDGTMSAFADEVLRGLSALATKTNSVAGFTEALVTNLAIVGAVDIKAEGREDFVIAITQRLRSALAEQVREADKREAAHNAMREAIGALLGRSKPEPPTTH